MTATKRPVALLLLMCAASSALRIVSSQLTRSATHIAIACGLACGQFSSPTAVLAVSGGGKDFSGMSVEGQDFSGQKLSGKEFRGIRGAGAIFKGTKLDATSFFKADLSNANFAGADLTGASLGIRLQS